jgi:3-dehydroquinate dehydratase-2
VNGPNLNLLGIREPDVYGHDTLADVERIVQDAAAARASTSRRSRARGCADRRDPRGAHHLRRDRDQPRRSHAHLVVLRDALSGVSLPVAEVHISNVYERESFRHHSYVADVAAVHVVGEASPATRAPRRC